MNTLLILIVNILPLYLLIGLGYIAGRWLDVNLHSLARVAIFILAPIVTFGAVAKLHFDLSYAALPFIMAGLSTFCALSMYALARRAWHDNTANLIGIGSVSGNTGYFGLPLVIALHGSDWTGVYLMMNFGVSLAEATLGYFLGARGHHSIRESLIKVAKLPLVHAMYLGLLFNFSGLVLPDVALRFWTNAVGAWSFIGMMLIGVALSKLPSFAFDWRLMRWIFGAKFLLWPLIGLALILLDQNVLHAFPQIVYSFMLIMVSVPPAGNLVAYAAQLDLHPERAAMVALTGTLFAVLFMPAFFLIVRLFGLAP